MKTQTSIPTLLRAMLLVGVSTLGACADTNANDDGADTTGGQDSSDGSASMTSPMTTAPMTTSPMTTTDTTTTANPTTSTTDPTDTTETTDVDDSSSDESTTLDPEDFDFPDEPYEAYTQIDRHGAVEAGTAGILAPEGLGFNPGSDISLRDDYNASNPAEDADGMWLSEIAASITFFHGALDDDISALGLIPATFEETLAQAGPVILPDTIKYNPALPTSYPNGRRLEDPVVDITLAAVLLQLGPNQPLSLFADLPLNPPVNDVPFQAEFPYLASPHLQ